MQFVANGPDVPEALLQAHEEGRVVFFCGAGISYPAKLPGFKGLVDKIYAGCGDYVRDLEVTPYSFEQYDTTLELLERRLEDGRTKIRAALAAALTPNLRAKGATETHTALLRLALNRSNSLRLVTTNFDQIFERVAKRDKLLINSAIGPMLPIPKSRWNNLVYLHGLVPKTPDAAALDHLVITSGDFGRAYLTERWAARFVSELFRNYVVCFVGYSINDPVMRYMMDALAADRLIGEQMNPAYAFGECSPGSEADTTAGWQAKGVIPVLYNVSVDGTDHSALHRTLKVWSETYRDGISGRERIIVENAIARPSASTKQDDFVGRVLWALSDATGLPAKRFADLEPVPTLEWLEAFTQNKYCHDDLARFGVPPHPKPDQQLTFSIARRPAPYTLAPLMQLASSDAARGSGWDDVMRHLARWLLRHLDDPSLILWFAQSGGHPHPYIADMIMRRIDEIVRLESDGNQPELDRIRQQSPNAIPRSELRPFWRALACGQVQRAADDYRLYSWIEMFKREGLTSSLRVQLRKLLAPKIRLGKAIRWREAETEIKTPERIRDIISVELVLASDHAAVAISDLRRSKNWGAANSALFDDFEMLLRDALDLQSELDEGDKKSDRSFWDMPSIQHHWQNRGYREWTILIELVRDAWLNFLETDKKRAQSIALSWFDAPYATFKRLALFAVSQTDIVPAREWVTWITGKNAWWLWSIDTRREVMRLLVLRGQHLHATERGLLEKAILAGPPREMYLSDVSDADWQSLVADNVWLRLAKLKSSGATLGRSANKRLHKISAANPDWQLSTNERDEFSHWMSGTGDPDYVSPYQQERAPRRRHELALWLKRDRSKASPFQEDNWRELCVKNPRLAAHGLRDLAEEKIWPTGRWQTALSAWSEEGNVERSWLYVRRLVHALPIPVFGDLLHGIAWWLESVSKKIKLPEPRFMSLCSRVFEALNVGVTTDAPTLTNAINHPAGLTAQALLNVWLEQSLKDDMGLSEPFRSLFTMIYATSEAQLRPARMLLSSQVITLFRVDRAWTEKHMLSKFDWAIDASEAKAAWMGYLWSPRIFLPIFVSWKGAFLETAKHYNDLSDHHRNYAAVLTHAALGSIDTYSDKDFRTALAALPQPGLLEVAETLVQALDSSGEEREAFWDNRIRPFWKSAWPKSKGLKSKELADRLARLSMSAGNQFPNALTEISSWLMPLGHPYRIVKLLTEKHLCSKFPGESLHLLDKIIDDQSFTPTEFGKCLDEIIASKPALKKDPRFQRLEIYRRKRSA
jgi:hypothetical protein